MLKKYHMPDKKNTDLNIYSCGMEDCLPDHSWGPAVRDHYIVHYVLGGKGIYETNGSVYRLSNGDGFLISPYTVVYYKADSEEPWSYCWVGFHGLKAETFLKQANLSVINPIFRYGRDDFLKNSVVKMIEAINNSKGRDAKLLGLLYNFLACLIEAAGAGATEYEAENRKELYVKKAVEYISMNYSRNISIREISRYIGLDRSYLSSVFKECLGVSPRDFLINYRLEKACELMAGSSLSIGEIARSVGYEDPLVFSKAFRQSKGLCPREYRKNDLRPLISDL